MGAKSSKDTGVQIDGLLKTYEKDYKRDLTVREGKSGRSRASERCLAVFPCLKWWGSVKTCLKRSKLIIVAVLALALCIALLVIVIKFFFHNTEEVKIVSSSSVARLVNASSSSSSRAAATAAVVNA